MANKDLIKALEEDLCMVSPGERMVLADKKIAELEAELNAYKAALNQIALHGSSKDAYTTEFTNFVVGKVREVLAKFGTRSGTKKA